MGATRVKVTSAEVFIIRPSDVGWTSVKSYADEDMGEVVFMAQPGVRKLFARIKRETVDMVLCQTLERLCSRFVFLHTAN